MIVGARREVLQQCLCLKSPQISRCGGGAEEVGSHEVTQKRSRAVLDVTAAIYDRLGTMFIDEKRVSLPRLPSHRQDLHASSELPDASTSFRKKRKHLSSLPGEIFPPYTWKVCSTVVLQVLQLLYDF